VIAARRHLRLYYTGRAQDVVLHANAPRHDILLDAVSPMFDWFRPKCPVEPDVKVWVERRMGWLIGQFGADRLAMGKVILPTDEFFPAPYDGSEADARVLLDQVCQYMDIDPACVDLFFYSERQQIAVNTEVTRPEGGTAGLYSEESGRTAIWLEGSRMADPISVAATFAYDLCHAHLLGDNRISPEEEDHEPLTDLATVYFGIGIFTANSPLRDKSYHAGGMEYFSISRHGYLTAPILAYALAVFAWLRGETEPYWDRYLRLDVRSPFRKAMSFLKRSKGAALLCEDNDEFPAFLAGLRPRLGLQPRDDSAMDETGAASPPTDCDDPHLDDRFSEAIFSMQRGDSQVAAELLSEVLCHDPQDGEAYQQRALAYVADGKQNEALADAEKAVELLPDDCESYRVRGTAYLDSQRYDLAIADFTRYITEEDITGVDPGRVAEVYHLRGTAYAGSGEQKRAVSDFTKAILRWPQWPAPYESRAAAYERLGNTRKALADRQEAAQRVKSLGNHEPAPGIWTSVIHLPGIH
jgi:tetratricopeptide (TPR) repeat protein